MDPGDVKKIALALCVAAGVLLAGIGHGLPEVYVPDTHIIRNALGMAAERNLWPPAGTYSTYPYFLAYLLLPIYGLTYLAGRGMGCYASPEDFGRQVVENPTVVYLEARLLVVLFGLAAVFFLYRTVRRLGGTPTRAAAAALFLGTGPLFVQFAHQARPWIPVTAGATAVLYFTLRAVQEGRRRDWVLAAAAAGATFAMHQVGGAVLFVPLAGYVAERHGRAWLRPRALGGGLGIVVLFAATALVLGYGHRVFGGPGREVIDTHARALDIGGQKLVFDYFSGALAGRMVQALVGYDPVALFLGVPALVIGLFRSRFFAGLRAPVAAFTLFVAALFLLYDGAHVRYFLPLFPMFAMGSAVGGGWIADRLRVKEEWVLLVLLLLPLVQSARLDLLLCREDTRDRARAWIEARVPTGARIAVEGYGPDLPPNRAGLHWLESQGVWLRRKERLLLGNGTGEGGPAAETRPRYFVIPLDRFYAYKSYWPHQYRLGGERAIGAFLEAVGAEWVVTADQRPALARHPPLPEFLEARAAAGPRFSPGGGTVPPEANLPLELDFALFSLWRVERPGPVIRIWRVKHAGRGPR